MHANKIELGLMRGKVRLADYNSEWVVLAADKIELLKKIFGNKAKDIQHIGSTSIKGIKAKPIIDIAIAVMNLDEVTEFLPILEQASLYKSVLHAIAGDVLVCDGDENANTRSYHIHIVEYDSVQWKNYLGFRDYLNSNVKAAKEYEQVKIHLAQKYSNDRNAYTNGKDEIVENILRKINKIVPTN